MYVCTLFTIIYSPIVFHNQSLTRLVRQMSAAALTIAVIVVYIAEFARFLNSVKIELEIGHYILTSTLTRCARLIVLHVVQIIRTFELLTPSSQKLKAI